MAVLIETYEMTETSAEDGLPECETEALDLIQRLGLTGQQTLLTGPKGERSPYRKMTAEEHKVYSVLMGKKTAIREYSDGAIPLRVLQIAAHAQGIYKRIEVWHAPNADIKDPVLVGVNGDTYGKQEFFLLARWGEALAPFAELMALAAKLWRGTLARFMDETRREAQTRGESLTACTDEEVLAMEKPTIYWK